VFFSTTWGRYQFHLGIFINNPSCYLGKKTDKNP
jgi:hypothetical protein